MANTCPYSLELECDEMYRVDEFYRQMSEAMLQNRPIFFVSNGRCVAQAADCMKLREFKFKQLQQKQK